MRISLIGAGRVATHLAQGLCQQHEIVQVFSRNLTNAYNLANAVNAEAIDEFQQLKAQIDVLIIAVSDQAISSVIESVSILLPDVLIVHTSGSTHLKALTQHHAKSGVFYPLQTFSLEREVNWGNTPLFVEAECAEDLKVLNALAATLSERIYQYDSAQRLSLHLAAVFACNFSNYCYDMAKQVLDAKQVDFSLLYPLIIETAHKATQNDPKRVQTGPAMRGDQNILMMHQQMLADAGRSDLKMIYESLSGGIMRNS